MGTPTDWDRVARAAYEAQYEGRPLISWDLLFESEKRAWVSTTIAAVREFLFCRLEIRNGRREG